MLGWSCQEWPCGIPKEIKHLATGSGICLSWVFVLHWSGLLPCSNSMHPVMVKGMTIVLGRLELRGYHLTSYINISGASSESTQMLEPQSTTPQSQDTMHQNHKLPGFSRFYNTGPEESKRPPPFRGHEAPPSLILKRYPGFDYSSEHVKTGHEEKVVALGYPWVRTQKLDIKKDALGSVPGIRPIRLRNLPPYCLALHGHSGLNTHLIVEGDLTLERRFMLDQPMPLDKATISAGGPVEEAPVGAGDIYDGTTRHGCKFVEGHRCLSPTTAKRYLDRGTLQWFSEVGKPASNDEQEFILHRLDDYSQVFGNCSDAVVLPESLSSVELHEGLDQKLQDWFREEWVGEDLDRMPAGLCNVESSKQDSETGPKSL